MNAEEIRLARKEVETRIFDLLEQLQRQTGMRLRSVEVDLLHTSTYDWRERTHSTAIRAVNIDLQL